MTSLRLMPMRAAPGDGALDGDGAANGLHGAGELRHQAIAGDGEDAPLVLGDEAGRDLAAGGEHRHRRLLVLGHEPAVAGDVGGPDGGETALVPGRRFHHDPPPPRCYCRGGGAGKRAREWALSQCGPDCEVCVTEGRSS
jgi:hypothetical protein